MSRPQGELKVKKNLYLDEKLCSTIDILLTPLGEIKPPHGAWSGFVESLIRQHLKQMPAEQLATIEKRLALRDARLKESTLSQFL